MEAMRKFKEDVQKKWQKTNQNFVKRQYQGMQ